MKYHRGYRSACLVGYGKGNLVILVEQSRVLTTTAVPVTANLGMQMSLTTCPSDPAF